MITWPEFYDPDLYEQKVGPGLRVGPAYRELLRDRPNCSVVEFGCGPGEVLIELAREGHYVVGIDRAPEMVARARQRAAELPPELRQRISVVEADMSIPVLPHAVDAVLLTNELVLHVLQTEALLSMFTTMRMSLKPAGVLLLDLPDIDFEVLTGAIGRGGDVEYCRGYFELSPDITLRVTEQIRFAPESRIKEMYFRYDKIDQRGNLIGTQFRRLTQRVWTVDEIRLALRQAGFLSIDTRRLDGYSDRCFIRAE